MSDTDLNGKSSPGVRAAEAASRRFGRRLAGVYLVLGALLVLAGYVYVSRRQAEARSEAHRELRVIADLKFHQISNWREERLSDARFFGRARFVAEDVRRFLEDPNSEAARTAVLGWLNLLKNDDRYYAVMVFDTRFERRLAVPAAVGEPAASVRGSLEKALQSHDVVFSDLHRDEGNGLIHLDIVFPIFEGADPKQARPIAIVLLKLDARHFLFPLIQSWPTPSRTAETLLVRREGESVLYLNDLRYRRGAALALRSPLTSANLPAAMVLRGQTGVIEGMDYRGVPVVAAGRMIPGTSWAMVAKMDRAEVYAPLRQQVIAAVAVLGTLLGAAALLMGLLWRQRSAQFLERELAERKAHEREMERLNRLYAALSQVNQAVVRATTRDELLREICRVLVSYGGFQMAWVGWVDQASGRVVPRAQFGDEAGYLEHIQVFADERPEGQGPVGTAIREGRPSVCNDISADPRVAPWREEAARCDWCSLAAFPIRQEGEIRGVLAVYARLKDFFGAQEQSLIEEAGADVSFGLDTLLNDERRRESEEALRQSEERYRSLFENMLDGFAYCKMLFDDEGRAADFLYLQVNSAFGRLTGLADVVGKKVTEVVPGIKEAHPELFEVYGRVALTGKPERFDIEVKPLGAWLSISVYSTEKEYFAAVFENISERKRAEAALRESEERFRTMADAMPQLAWIAQADGYLSWYNRRWYEYTGTTPQQMEGWGWQSVHDPQVLPRVLEQWRGSIATGQPFEMEFPLRGADGRFRPFLTRVMPLKNGEGRVVRWFGTNTDITDLVAARETLARSRIELEHLVAERTAQLVEANANLQTFVYSAAHDLRSPLRAIRSFSGIALQQCGPQLASDGKLYLQRVCQCADQMDRLLNDLLEYSRLSQAEMKLEEIDLGKAVGDALGLLESEIRAKNAEVLVGESMGSVIGHPATVVLIVTNFVSNALKFMPLEVQPRIRILAEKSAGCVQLSVEDNGIGIAEGDLPKMFGAFQRLHGKQAYPGTGLGLAIVRKGAERMGGRVGVESEVGRGSRFWVELQAGVAEPRAGDGQLASAA